MDGLAGKYLGFMWEAKQLKKIIIIIFFEDESGISERLI